MVAFTDEFGREPTSSSKSHRLPPWPWQFPKCSHHRRAEARRPFSHAVETDGFVFVTGQMPDAPETLGVLPDGIVAQTHNVMANLRTVLAGRCLGFDHVVMARSYLTRFKEDYAAMNEAYRRYFAAGRLPACTCVGVAGLAYDAQIEIDLVVRRPI